jgi:hypothetical protein
VLTIIIREALKDDREYEASKKQYSTFPPKPTQVRPPENLLSYVPKSITFESTRQNNGNGSSVKGRNITPKEEYISTGVSIKSNGKGGTKSSPQNATSVKQRLDVFVSNLRRYFYHQPNIDDEKAEKIIDAKLLKMKAKELYGYTKSQRRMPPGGYAPIK